jgi:hypothetical protein
MTHFLKLDEVTFAKVDLIIPPGPGTNGGTPLPEDRQPAGGTTPATNELNPGTFVLLYGEDQTNRVATTLTLKVDPTGGSVTLDQHGLTDLKIYTDEALHEELTLPKTWTNGETPPSTLYMVGSSSSTNLQSAQGTLDLTYKANLAANGGEYSIKDTVGVTLLPVDIIPNFNRDETIDLAGSKDRGKVTEQKPLRWWINDDSDNGDIASGDSDVPGALTGWFEWDGRTPNHDDTKVNGRCDLPDFFPLFFDLKTMIEVLPPSGSIQYKFKHEEDALGFVYTDLMPDQADDFCIEDATTGYGPNFTQPAKDATVTKITSAGVVLSTTFLNKIKDDGKGVLLFEASKATTKPLILEVTKDGQKLTEVKFFLKVDSVEKMYRWVNLRGEIGANEERPTNVGQPDNYPDDLTNGKNLIQVHGYSVSEKGARGWNAEVFKRMHQLGSKAKFVAVTWRGDDSSQFTFGWRTPDYHENVTHAFETSQHLAAAVNGLAGEKYIIGHSLGNMLVSSAIKDRSMSVNKYFAVDAAVAAESYDPALEQNGGMRDLMRNPDWQNYNTRLWSTEWYKLFGSGDGRNTLTWRGRFGAFGNMINFHSTGEEVLRNPPDGGVPTPSTDGDLAWVLQEKAKGALLAFLSTLDSHGGWGFNANWDNIIGYDPQTGIPITVRRTPTEADTLTNAQLQTDSFFKRFADNRLYNASQGSAAANEYVNRARMLAEGIPALSFPTGSNPLTPFGTARNVDLMNLKTGTWPRGNGQWRHSDYREVAFYFTQRLYKRFIDEGGLKQ